jgi:hypothetical protein
MVYIVFAPGKKGKEYVSLVTTDLEAAKSDAIKLRNKYQQKGWDSWANRVRIVQPKTAKFACELANELVHKGNALDMMNQGGTFRGDGSVIAMGYAECFYEWASILRKAFKIS